MELESPVGRRGDQNAVALRFSGITKRYPGVVALDDVSLEVKAGEVLGLVGENGAGKSTLMGIGAGATEADEGTVEIAGQRRSTVRPDLARDLGLAIVYQEPALMPDLTVAENLAIATSKERRPGWWSTTAWANEAMGRVDQGRAQDRPDPGGPRPRPRHPLHRRDLQGAGAGTEGAAARRADRAPRRRRRRDPLRPDPPARRRGHGDRLHLPPHPRGAAGRPTGSACCATAVQVATLEAEGASQDSIVTSIVGRSLETEFPPKRDPGAAAGEPVLEAKGLRSDRFADFDLDHPPG